MGGACCVCAAVVPAAWALPSEAEDGCMTWALRELEDVEGPSKLGWRRGRTAIAGKLGALALGVILLPIFECGDPGADPFMVLDAASCFIGIGAISTC